MKKLLLSLACVAMAPFALAQTATTTTTTYTDGTGTITEYSPGQTVVLKETTGVRPYKFSKTTTYVTRSGKNLSDDEVRARIKIGSPIHIRFTKHENDMVVDRVTVDD
jgi:hypothetical protein